MLKCYSHDRFGWWNAACPNFTFFCSVCFPVLPSISLATGSCPDIFRLKPLHQRLLQLKLSNSWLAVRLICSMICIHDKIMWENNAVNIGIFSALNGIMWENWKAWLVLAADSFRAPLVVENDSRKENFILNCIGFISTPKTKLNFLDAFTTSLMLTKSNAVCVNTFACFFLFTLDDEFGAEGGGPSEAPHNPPQSQPSFHDHPSNQPPASNFTNIQIPPGSHAPANTPAEIPHPEGKLAELKCTL